LAWGASRSNRQAHARVRRAAEQAKIALSAEPFVWVREEYLAEKNGAALHMEIEVSRAQFISLIEDLLMLTLDSVDRVLKDGGIEQPEHVMLVGGSTYIPAVRDIITEHLGVTPRHDVNPSEAVALGAGIQGAIIEGQPLDVILVDVTPFSLGIAIAEVLPMGYMVEDRYKVLIPRNSTIPVTQKEAFTTVHPAQTSVKIEVYQGERAIASENTLLGEFIFSNLKPEKDDEEAQFTVQFDLDLNGILKVQAVDRGSQKSEAITVRAEHHRVSQQELSSETLPDFDVLDDDDYDDEDDDEAEDVAEVSDGMRREAEVLLTRARQVAAKQLADEIAAVKAALSDNDADTLQDALEDLSDALFDLED
jgi:molecular chaperone DnaK